MISLTARQRELLAFIREYISRSPVRFPPSFEEMRVGLGLASKSSIHRLVAALEERGAITREGWGRLIQLPEDAPEPDPKRFHMSHVGDDWRLRVVDLPVHGRINRGDLPSVRPRPDTSTGRIRGGRG